MKKIRVFLPVIAIILAVFACDLPEKIEIIGTPSARFAANMDIGDMFTDRLKEGLENGDDLYILDCTNNALELQTFLVGIVIPDMDLTFDDGNILSDKITIGGIEYDVADTVGEDITLTDDIILVEDRRFEIDFSDLNEIMEGFKFTNKVKSSLFLYCDSDILNVAEINLSFDGIDHLIHGEDIDSLVSGVDPQSGEYSALTMPPGGEDISSEIRALLNKGSVSDLIIDIFIPKEKSIRTAWLGDHFSIFAEIIIWLPLEFVTETGGDITIPELFSDDEDLFGRDTADGGDSLTDVFESMYINIQMNKNPFKDAVMIVESGTAPHIIEITSPLKSNALNFEIDKTDMEKINDPAYFPFIPNIKIRFEPEGIFGIPRNFTTTAISFEAKIKYTYDLAGD